MESKTKTPKSSFLTNDIYEILAFTLQQDVCDYLISHSVLVHLNNKEDKFNLVVFMLKKLFSLAQVRRVNKANV